MNLGRSLMILAVASVGISTLGGIGLLRAETNDGGGAISPDLYPAASIENPAEGEEKTGSISDVPEKPPAVLDPAGARPAFLEALATKLPTRSRSAAVDAAKAAVLKPLIARYALEHGIPYEFADAVIRIESRYNAGARNGPNLGLTQVNFRTAQSLGYTGEASGLFDAETNLRYGLKYLAQAYKLAGGDMCGAVLRYQFGHRTTAMTGASRAYCAKVKTILAASN